MARSVSDEAIQSGVPDCFASLAMTKALQHRHTEVLGAQHRASKGTRRDLGAVSFKGRRRTSKMRVNALTAAATG